MSFFVRGKECDPKGTFPNLLFMDAILDCIDHTTDFILHNDLYEYMECFSLKRCYEGQVCVGISKRFYWHDCKCGLPKIICKTSPFLKQKYIASKDQPQLDIELDYFFTRMQAKTPVNPEPS